MRRDINKKMSAFFRLLLQQKTVNKSVIHPPPTTSGLKTTSKLWLNITERICHLKMKFCTDDYFHETLCLKINWNVDRNPLCI